jgi:hypothetical protein
MDRIFDQDRHGEIHVELTRDRELARDGRRLPALCDGRRFADDGPEPAWSSSARMALCGSCGLRRWWRFRCSSLANKFLEE